MASPTPSINEGTGRAKGQKASNSRKSAARRTARIVIPVAIVAGLALSWAAWLGNRASLISEELDAATQLAERLKSEIPMSSPGSTRETVNEMREHTIAARKAAGEPLWTLAAGVPWVGPNFSAVTEIAGAADDVVGLGLDPLIDVYGSLDWGSLLPSSSGTDLGPLKSAAPTVTSAAYAVRASSDRLAQIDTSRLFPQVSEPLTRATDQLGQITGTLDAAADASTLAPAMLGADGPRSYLLMIQNNAESRASGGIPGALAVLTVDNGKLSLGEQGSAGDVGIMSPTVGVDPEQQQIYSGRLGKFMQDVNLTPDFPTAATSAQAMWERKFGKSVDGVISIDPIALGYILDATGPVEIDHPEFSAVLNSGLPNELNGKNVVQTLLSDVYAKIEQPKLQDAYFAAVAQKIFAALSDGQTDEKGLIEGITRGTAEGRILVWSAQRSEQAVIASYPLSGSIAGPSVPAAQFGVYFNDGTGAKMDYYVRRTVQLVKECAKDGYEQITVRVTSTNTAPSDAASSLPPYVTGAGNFGIPAGAVQTNIVAYGPVQANVETVQVDGAKTEFAPYLHSSRPVGVLAVRLAPGESRTIDFTFGKIVQHTEPNLVVTPSVQDVKDVILPTQIAQCG